MSSAIYKIAVVIVVIAVAATSVTYFYYHMPSSKSSGVQIKGVSMVSSTQIGKAIGGGQWKGVFSIEGGSYISPYLVKMLTGSFESINTSFNGNQNGSGITTTIPAMSTYASDVGMMLFNNSTGNEHLAGAYIYFINGTAEGKFFSNLTNSINSSSQAVVSGSISGNPYIIGWGNKSVNGSTVHTLISVGQKGSYVVLFILFSTVSVTGTDSGILNIMQDEFGILPSSSMVLPPYMITSSQISSDIGENLNAYAFMSANFTGLGTMLNNGIAKSIAKSEQNIGNSYDSSLNFNNSNITSLNGSEVFSYLNNLSSVSIIGGFNFTNRQVILVGSIGTNNSLSTTIYAVLHEFAISNKNLTVQEIDSGNGFSVTTKSGNITIDVVSDGNYLVFVVSYSLGAHKLTNTQMSALVSSEESALN